MTASITKYCFVNNLFDIKKSLCPEEKTKQEVLQDDDWDNRWNWDTSELMYDAKEDISNKHVWLSDCIIALSPLMDMLVIGRHKTLTIFTMNNTPVQSEEISCHFNLTYDVFLPGLEADEGLSNILLLPFVSQQKAIVNFRDWTAILVGFSSGYFRVYAENGKLLLSYLFHNEPILDIKCRTHSANQLLGEQTDEILIIYSTAVVQIDGFTLYQTLRVCRNNLAKSSHIDNSQHDSNQTPFTFKKWNFASADVEGRMQDCVNVCTFVKNDFDALVSRSITGKPLNNDSANLFFTTGIHPFAGFYRAQEGTTHTIFDELSQVFLNKVKNVFAFFSQTKSKNVDPRDNVKPATMVQCDIGLYDERFGCNICLSPNRRLAAVVDDFGRVILFDLQHQMPVRIWKGYRRAQVAWIVVNEDSSEDKTFSRQALFLVIYAPKRGIVEIWCAQNGPRVTAFKVGKNCKLFYIDHVMFGLNHLILQNIKRSLVYANYMQTFHHSKCYLFDYSTGELFQLRVPFLCSLTDRNSKKTRDFHILKDLKTLFKAQQKDDSLCNDKLERFHQQVVTLIALLKTSEMKRSALDELIQLSNDVDLILLCARNMRKDLLTLIERNELDFEGKLVAQMCARIIQICETYVLINQQCNFLSERMVKLAEQSQNPPDIQKLIENVGGWSGNDIARILSLLAFRQSVLKSASSSLMHQARLTISEMLSHFSLYYSHLVKQNNVEIYERLPTEIILMRKNEGTESKLDTNKHHYVTLDRLALFLFECTFFGEHTNLDYFISQTCIFPSNLLLLLFTSWLESSSSSYWPCWENFSNALFKLVDYMNHIQQQDEQSLLFDPFTFDDRLLSPSWTDIFELIYKSSNITSSLLSVNMIKSLINKCKLDEKDISEVIQKEAELEEGQLNNADIISTNSVISTDNDWETLHMDKENLGLLTKQFEDLFLLDMLLKSNLCSESAQQQQYQSKSAAGGHMAISLSLILTSGPGIVAEIVARWAVQHHISPELLICSPSVSLFNEDNSVRIANQSSQLHRTVESSTNATTDLAEIYDQSTLMEILNHVRLCFPNCLESDNLLINCCWELLLQWHRQPLILNDRLPQILNYLEKVSSSVLKHNVACMGWQLFFQKRLEILCNLIEKMGKKPKDRIAKKELEMDENTLEYFVGFCCEWVDLMVRSSVISETEALPVFALDEWWCNFNAVNQYSSQYIDDSITAATSDVNLENLEQQTLFVSSQGQSGKFVTCNVPLAMRAMNKKAANLDLLVEYSQLCLVVQFIVTFSLKSARPLSLFPSSVRAYFFNDLVSFFTSNSNKATLVPFDPVLNEARFNFLLNVIVALVQTLPSYHDEAERFEGFQHYRVANKWFNKVIMLSHQWELNLDKVRLQYVYNLFLFGCDPLAEEVMRTVPDSKNLARNLLTIGGMRLAHMLNNRYGSLDQIPSMPPNIIFWLKSLVTDPNCFLECPPSSTKLLLENISNYLCLEEDSPNYKICNELLLALKRMD